MTDFELQIERTKKAGLLEAILNLYKQYGMGDELEEGLKLAIEKIDK